MSGIFGNQLVKDNQDEAKSEREEDEEEEEFDSDDYDSDEDADERTIVGKKDYTISSSDVNFYDDAINVLDMIDNKKLGVNDLIKLYPKPEKSNTFATHPYALKYIPYDDALKLFAEFENVTNEVGRLFIALQFFIYFHNKKDKNIQELIAFCEKVEDDRSKLVRTCGPILFKYFKVSFFNIPADIDRLFDLFTKGRNTSNVVRLSEIRDFTTYRKYIENSNKFKYKFNKQDKQQQEEVEQQQPPLKRQRVTPTLPQDCFDKIVQKIIGYTLMADTFLQQDLLPETQTEEWSQLMVELSGVLFSLALVSKQFFTNVGCVLETLNWTGRFPNKYIKGQINYDKQFCMFKKVPSSIRYEAIIRTTPYRLLDQVLRGVTSLTIVGDTLNWECMGGVDKEFEMSYDNYYNIEKSIFVTYPPIGSMPNLTKLVVVGRAFKFSYKQKAETGGLYLLKYLIANTGCKLEHFECIEQLSLGHHPEYDLSFFQCLLEHHASTLKLFKLKRTVKNEPKYLARLSTIVQKLKRYQSKHQFKLEFYDSNPKDDSMGDTEEAYKLVEEYKNLPPVQIDSGDDNYDDDSEDDDSEDDDSDYYISIRVSRLAKLVIPLFESKIIAIDGNWQYSKSIVDKETYTIRSTDVSFYGDAMNVIEKIDKRKIGIDDLIKLYPEPGKSNDFATHPYLLKYIPYDDALKLFAQFDHVKNEIGRLFIVLQFFIYFHNKKDKNIQELIAFGEKVEADRSTIVRTSGPIMFKHFKVSFFNVSSETDSANNLSKIRDFKSYRKFIENNRVREEQQQQWNSKSQQQQKSLKILIETPIITQDTIIRQIIGYSLMADTFFQQDLLPEKDADEGKELMILMSSVLFSLAMVSKQFFTNVGRFLESIDWTGRFPNKYIKGQINYDKPFCLFKKVPSSIRYDALIRTTPYRLLNQTFSGVTSLTIVGDTLDWGCIYGFNVDYELERDNYYDIEKRIFVTYPPVGSMPNLTKLVVVGRAFQSQRSPAETGGLYLLNNLLILSTVEKLHIHHETAISLSVRRIFGANPRIIIQLRV
ncbi:hypothetical protein PPL_03423 [Heterostelium album PN500]|uniref:Uncharacterized protein n=1 Tax=Heterostelium pallidum (strain ATCC 26659 / Pp 5 / PN500) TaxID=670386 RepID=D3B4U7_HETP5|nr:hypothetical protein PPL_03423 [Heterostelium album PN500]EFA84345.1 hypothetical protein PPL_03423 [Heterostelium album PN500]|eukprot:XP_020436460.1 hypothetical protein PPL_03423 [Heterostelium album PN500]